MIFHQKNNSAQAGVNRPKIAFFGTPEFAVWVLDALAERGIIPDLIVCAPDAPKGRKLIMTPPHTKVWAEKHDVPVIQPEKIKTVEFATELSSLAQTLVGNRDNSGRWDLFIVAAYGKIIPENILYMPVHKTINVHPSLLPLLRGSSPLQSAILQDMSETGVTIMRLDKEMDHGPILAQKESLFPNWPVNAEVLGKTTAKDGGNLIADLLPEILSGKAKEIEQDHSLATYTKKISKEDGLIDLSGDPYENFLKFNAYKGWPGIYFFKEKNGKKIRIVITEAVFQNGEFIIKKVIPEGRAEISWNEFNSSI